MGGCEDDDVDKDNTKTEFEELLKQIHIDALQEEEDDASDSSDTHLVYELIKGLKLLKITWSVKEKSVYRGNESHIDIAIAKHHQDDDIYFFLRQCINLVDGDIGNKQKICCGVLIYKLNHMNSNTNKNALSSTNVQFYIPNNLVERFTGIVSLVFLISTFSNTPIML